MRKNHSICRLGVIGALIAVTAVSVAAQGTVAKEYKRLVVLRDKLAKIPMEKLNREPHRSFIKRNKRDIVYSEPAGQWFVRSDRFWTLAKRNKNSPLADDIAWTAAENPLPGECEGYLNCYVYNANATLGEYLRMFPAGKHKKEAIQDLVEWMDPYVNNSEGTYDGPTDAADKAEFQKMIAELRSTVERVKDSSGNAISILDKMAEKYK